MKNNMQIKAFQLKLMRDLNDSSGALTAAFSVHIVGSGPCAEKNPTKKQKQICKSSYLFVLKQPCQHSVTTLACDHEVDLHCVSIRGAPCRRQGSHLTSKVTIFKSVCEL